MTLSLTIAVIVIADLALIAGVAYVMSRAARLTPHRPAAAPVAPRRAWVASRASARTTHANTRPLAARS
jgi:hypothetical protein